MTTTLQDSHTRSDCPEGKDLIDLKGLVDADWLIPKTDVQKVLHDKAEEGSINIIHWRRRYVPHALLIYSNIIIEAGRRQQQQSASAQASKRRQLHAYSFSSGIKDPLVGDPTST